MEDNVILKINSTQRDAVGEENCIELFTVGRYYYKNGVRFVTYKETEVSGMEGSTTVLKIYKDHVVLLRLGSFRQKQEFMPGVVSQSAYMTPYGKLDVQVQTQKVSVDVVCEAEKETVALLLKIAVKYELEIDGKWQSTNTLSITIQGDGRKNGY